MLFSCSLRLAEVSSGKMSWDTSRSDLPRGLYFHFRTIPDDSVTSDQSTCPTIWPLPSTQKRNLHLQSSSSNSFSFHDSSLSLPLLCCNTTVRGQLGLILAHTLVATWFPPLNQSPSLWRDTSLFNSVAYLSICTSFSHRLLGEK